MITDIYVTTDLNEVKQLLSKRDILRDIIISNSNKVRRDNYNFTFERVIYRGKCLNITNIPIKNGEEIKSNLGLFFNPISVISGDIDEKGKENLIRKLIAEKLLVAENNGNGIIHHFPDRLTKFQYTGT